MGKKKFLLIFLLISIFLLNEVLATDYNSATSGNWASATTWSPNGIPGTGDTVTIGASHTIILNDGRTIGTGAATAVTVNGSLTISGSLTLQGVMTLNANSILNMNAGSSLNIGTFNVAVNGKQTMNFVGSSGNRATVNSGGGAFTAGTNQVINFQYVDFNNLGDSYFYFGNDASSGLTMKHSRWINYVGFTITPSSATNILDIENCDFRLLSPNTNLFTIPGSSRASVNNGVLNQIIGSTFYAVNGNEDFFAHDPGLLFQGNILINGFYQAYRGDQTFKDNFYWKRNPNYGNTGCLYFVYNNYIQNNYIYSELLNSHTVQGFPGAGNWWQFSNNIFEGTSFENNNINPTREGNLNITHNILLGTGAFVTNIVDNSGSIEYIKQNTIYTKSSMAPAGTLWGTETNPYNSQYTALADNIVVDSELSTSEPAVYIDPRYTWQQLNFTDYNLFQNYADVYLNIQIAGKTEGVDYGFGRYDKINVNPQFVDPSRNLSKWDTSNGGTGIPDHALQEMLKLNGYGGTFNSAYSVSNLLSYIRAGFTPQNIALKNAGDPADGSHDLGAVPVAGQAPVTTNCTNRDLITTTCKCNNIDRSSGYCCYYDPAAGNITWQSTDYCGYTKWSPHWQNILVESDSGWYNVPASERIWNPQHFDMYTSASSTVEVTDLQGYKPNNPTGRYIAYRLDTNFFDDYNQAYPNTTDHNADYDGFYTNLKTYATSNGYNIEDAFLHYKDTTTVHFTVTESGNPVDLTVPGCPNLVSANETCRVRAFVWAAARWEFNPKSNLIKGFLANEWNRITNTSHNGYYFDGIFLDEHPRFQLVPMDYDTIGNPGRYLISGAGSILEYNNVSYANQTFLTQYYSDLNNLLIAEKSIMGNNGKLLLPNPSIYTFDYNLYYMTISQSLASSGAYLEAADDISVRWVEDPNPFVVKNILNVTKYYEDHGVTVIFMTTPYSSATDGFPYGSDSGSYSAPYERRKMAELSLYYLAKDAGNKLMYFGMLLDPGGIAQDYRNLWFGAINVDIGSPTSEYYIYQNGTYFDAQNSPTFPRPYMIIARNFTKGMVMLRPPASPWYGATPITVTLPQTMTALHSDGSQMVASNSFTLHNSEGVILLKQGQSPSNPSSDINSDGKVNIIDLAISVFNQGRDPANPSYSSLDLNQDGKIDFSDVRIIISSIF
jgi:hypothetical protein